MKNFLIKWATVMSVSGIAAYSWFVIFVGWDFTLWTKTEELIFKITFCSLSLFISIDWDRRIENK